MHGSLQCALTQRELHLFTIQDPVTCCHLDTQDYQREVHHLVPGIPASAPDARNVADSLFQLGQNYWMVSEACKRLLHVKDRLLNSPGLGLVAYEDTKATCEFMLGLKEILITTQRKHDDMRKEQGGSWNAWGLGPLMEKVGQLRQEADRQSTRAVLDVNFQGVQLMSNHTLAKHKAFMESFCTIAPSLAPEVARGFLFQTLDVYQSRPYTRGLFQDYITDYTARAPANGAIVPYVGGSRATSAVPTGGGNKRQRS